MSQRPSFQPVQEAIEATEFVEKVERRVGNFKGARQVSPDHAPSEPKIESLYIIAHPDLEPPEMSRASSNGNEQLPKFAGGSGALNIARGDVNDKFIKRPIRTPSPSHRSRTLQQWEGTVVEIRKDGFEALLRDLTAQERADERASFSFDEVSSDDQHLVALGAVFYWFIGYEITISGQRKLVSTVRFRRLPAWTKSEIEAINKEADELADFFGVYSSTIRATNS
jgi:hypothetical protein